MATQNVCFYNKYGYCKYAEKCRKFHEKETCEKSICEITECKLRHPIMCKYFRDYGFCKFTDWCKFSHKMVTNNDRNDEVKKLEKNLEALENKVKSKDEKIVKLESEIDYLKQKFIEMEENIKVKDDLINDLVLRIKVVEQKQNSSEEEAEKENLDVEKRSECETSVSERKTNDSASDIQDEKVFECDICTYKTKSENGIKIHKAKKHTNTCKCCNRTFTDQVDYSNHITECYSTYSYYDSPISPVHRIPPRFPPRFPHGSPPRFPPTYPPRFPRSPLY